MPLLPRGNAGITLSGTWLDVTGNILFSGFGSINLGAALDMTPHRCFIHRSRRYSAVVRSIVDLRELDLDRREDLSDHPLPLHLSAADGKVTVLPSGTSADGPIYSAGGSLTIESRLARASSREGYVAAPMGSISLAGAERPRLSRGRKRRPPRTGDAAVMYGTIHAGLGRQYLGHWRQGQPDGARCRMSRSGMPRPSPFRSPAAR